MMKTMIPANSHLGPAFTRFQILFTKLSQAKYMILDNIQAMIILSHLPHTMSVVVQLLVQTMDSTGNVIALILPQITAAATLNWEQCAHMGSTKDKEKGHGKCGSKKQREKKEKKYLNFIELKDSRSEGTSFSYFVHTAFIPAIMDPCIAAHKSVQLYQGTNGLSVFTWTQESFDFAHHLGIELLMECIHFLDAVLPLFKWLDFSSPPVIPSPSSSLLASPPAPISPPLISYIETIPEDDELIIYNCAFSIKDLNTSPPFKRSQKWVSEVLSSWREDDKVDIYRLDKDMTDLYDQYMKDPRYVAFPMIAASLS